VSLTPTFVQAQSAQAYGVAGVTTPAMTTTPGQWLCAMAARKSAVALFGSPVSDNYGNTWQLAWLDGNSHGTFGSGGLYYAENIQGGAGHTVTFTLPSGAPDGCALTVAEFANIAPTFSLNATAHTSNAGPGTAIPPIGSGSLAGVTAGQLLIGSGSVSHGAEPPASLGRFTDLYRADGFNHGGVILAYALVTAIGAYPYAYAFGSSLSTSESYGIASFKGSGIAYVQQTGVSSVVMPASITTPAITTTSGHLLVAIGTTKGLTLTGASITDSQGNTWAVAWANNTGGTGHAACFYVQNCVGGAGHTFTLSMAGDASSSALSVAEFSGVALTSALDQVATASGATRPYTTAAITTTQASELLVGGGSVSVDALWGYSTVPLDWTTRVALDCAASSSAEGVILASQIAAADGTYAYGVNTGAYGSSSYEAVGIASFQPGEPEPFVPLPLQTVTIRRMRRSPHLNVDHVRLIYNRFELLATVGAGLAEGQGSDPQIMLRWSDDGGLTWSREHWTTLGKLGATTTRVRWQQLGQARDRVFEVVVSDPVDCSLINAYVDVSKGTR